MAEHLYSKAGGPEAAPGGGPSPDGGAQPEAKPEDVIDVEFEEKK
jgi:hypothetical protein